MTNYESNVDELKKQFEDYEKQKEQKSGQQKREEILEKIYVPRKSKEIFRILPPKKGRFYSVAYFHQVEVNSSGGNKRWAKIYCPAHNDPKVPLTKNGKKVVQENGQPIMVPAPCALCEKHEQILSQQDDSVKFKKRDELNDEQKKIFDRNKKIFMNAKQYEARKFYIVKGINRWAPEDGPKFWRFKDSFTNRGVMDKLKSVLEDYMDRKQADFMSPKEGTDLAIIVGDAKTPAGKPYKDISAIQTRDPSPLHEDEYVAKSWLEDKSTWRDVFKPKKAPNITPEEYLEMLSQGNDPYYDEVEKKWVFPGNPELEEKANTRTPSETQSKKFEQASDLEDDDESDDNVTISNVTEKDVGKFEDDSVDVGEEVKNSTVDDDEPKKEPTPKKEDGNKQVTDDDMVDDDWDEDDLPF